MQDYTDEYLINIIAESKFFKMISKEEVVKLYPHFQLTTIKAGELLFEQGDFSDSLYILIDGSLNALLNNAIGITIHIGPINPIDVVGELGALSNESRSLTVEAITDSILLKLPAKTFREFSSLHPGFLKEISNVLVARSLNNIRLLAAEKPTYNITIIYPLIKNIPVESIKEKFKTILKPYDIEFISTDEMPFEHIKNLMTLSQREQRTLFLFMSDWQKQIFELCRDKTIHLYLVLNDEEKLPTQYFHDELAYLFEHTLNLRTELVLMHSAHIKRIVNTAKYLQLTKFHMHHHMRFNNQSDEDRLGRFMTGNAYTLVLGGGGVKGYAHMGVIQCLIEKGIPIDAIGGTSIGATVAACYAFTLDLNRTHTYLTRLGKVGMNSLKWRSLTLPVISLFSSNPGTSELMYLFDNFCIEDLIIPFFAVSANFTENKEVIHSSGLIWRALRASMAIPGVFPPMVIDGQLLFDGGLLNNLPVDIMRDQIGPDNIIVATSLSIHDNHPATYQFPPVFTFKEALFHILGFKKFHVPPFFETFRSSLLLGSSSKEVKNAETADILIKPNLMSYRMLSRLKTNNMEELIKLGYESTSLELEKYFAKEKFTKKE